MHLGLPSLVTILPLERNEDEREVFWELLNECLSGFSEIEKIIVLGDMNAKVGDHERGVTGKYGVPGVNENGECLVGMCAERRMIIGNAMIWVIFNF